MQDHRLGVPKFKPLGREGKIKEGGWERATRDREKPGEYGVLKAE